MKQETSVATYCSYLVERNSKSLLSDLLFEFDFQITSYGGRFRYTINYSEATDAQPISRIADVRITGNDITLVHKSGTHPAARSPRYFEIMMTEVY